MLIKLSQKELQSNLELRKTVEKLFQIGQSQIVAFFQQAEQKLDLNKTLQGQFLIKKQQQLDIIQNDLSINSVILQNLHDCQFREYVCKFQFSAFHQQYNH